MKKSKVIVVMPAYNAEKTIEKTYREIPEGHVDKVIVVDDASRDRTVEIAKKLGLKIVVHHKNKGYGGNQKTCYNEALKDGSDIVVMLHPDYQYDSKKVPEMIKPIIQGKYDVVLGSRMMGDGARKGGMPIWKIFGNRVLTTLENLVLGLNLSEYHTGLRAYNRKFLQKVPFEMNSDDFVFDQETIAQAVAFGFRIGEISVPTRYFKEASSINPKRAFKYGVSTLATLLKFILHKYRIKKYEQFGK
jgi:glycosyltransferase involved in cell wall biosynthesis